VKNHDSQYILNFENVIYNGIMRELLASCQLHVQGQENLFCEMFLYSESLKALPISRAIGLIQLEKASNFKMMLRINFLNNCQQHSYKFELSKLY